MLGLDWLVGEAEKKPQAVIFSLIALLAVGALGGGLWIQSLQSALSQRDALEKQYLTNIQSKNDLEEARRNGQVTLLANRQDELMVTINEASTDLSQVVKTLNDAVGKGKPVPTATIRGLADRIDFDRREMSRVSTLLAMTGERIYPPSEDLAIHGHGSSSSLAPLVTLGLVVIVLAVVYGIRQNIRRRRLSKSGRG